ncbi:MAG: glycerol-3-phosphate acyltransferase [Caulobacterales bacterium 68-7]|nr:glycerol-3-phosphate 1-O-acyltransferase PlsY [Caulobacterales bacterium]OJU09540.1 MAG: glycerol-3-phosphate acyltransferase [Caulobacterales bacterium 68-7]
MESLANAVWLTLGLTVLGGYLLGSIPFGLIATRLGGAGDIRKIGSGNIGATNVLRSGRKDLALITLLGDGGKGAVAVLLARWLTHGSDVVVALAGASAFVGHLFPIWLKFKGGKGVATFFGVLLAASWPVGVLAGATWLLMAYFLRYSSLSALAAAAMAPLFAFMTDRPYAIIGLSAFMAVLIFIRHHQNISRLLKGEEPKIGAKKAAAAAEPEGK